MHNQCENHHIASDKAKAGGFTDQHAELFEYAGVDLQYEKNIISLEDHKGGHTIVYKEWVLEGLKKYIKKENREEKNKQLLDMVLNKIAQVLNENNRLPYSDGKDKLDN